MLDDESRSRWVCPRHIHSEGIMSEPKWLEVARTEIGQSEVSGTVDNPRIREYHSATTLGEQHDEVAWCSSFVNWCLAKVGIVGTRSAAAASWVKWGEESALKPGSIVVIHNPGAANSALSRSGNHVGFLIEETETAFKLLGGNQHNSVCEATFPKSKWTLKACRVPA